eukprot:4868912-Amphidinium_carterae.1
MRWHVRVQGRALDVWVRPSATAERLPAGGLDGVLEEVTKDVSDVWAFGPFYSEAAVSVAVGCDNWVTSRRFAVVQTNKVRGVDDMSASL